MRPQTKLTWEQLTTKVHHLAWNVLGHSRQYAGVYGVPSGGAPIALMFRDAYNETLAKRLGKPSAIPMRVVDDPYYDPSTLIVDDICDSGATLLRYNPLPTAVLYTRPGSKHVPTHYLEETEDWIVFPYEKQEQPGTEIITRMLEFLGEDPRREGLLETPERVARAWQELFGGYSMDFKLTTFEQDCDEIVVSRDIHFTSFCEHHMLPFFGRVHIGYLPKGRIVGISKLSRLVEKYARRLQIQERLTKQIGDELMTALAPLGVAVVVEATHFCMVARGVRQWESTMVTSAMLGRFRESAPARAEFMALIGKP